MNYSEVYMRAKQVLTKQFNYTQENSFCVTVEPLPGGLLSPLMDVFKLLFDKECCMLHYSEKCACVSIFQTGQDALCTTLLSEQCIPLPTIYRAWI